MYGIDFGTSNTVVTVREGGETRLLDLGEGGVVPSLLYFERDRRASVGAEAILDYTEALARWKGSGNLYSHFRFFQALKLALKDPAFTGTTIFGERMTPESLAGIFLREVKRRADAALSVDAARSADRAGGDALVLGRPVVLSPDPGEDALIEARFRKAALLAGFSSVDFVFEPVAAAVDILGEEKSNVLVFDFGGGTLDISLARNDGDAVSILATSGADIGGYLLNEDISRSRIIRHFGADGKFRTMTGRELDMPRWITDQVASFYALPLADIVKTRNAIKDLLYDARREDKNKLRGLSEFLDRNLAFDLFRRIDEAKIELSSESDSSIAYAVPPYVSFSEPLSRAGFEALIAPRVEAARRLVEEALAKASLAPKDIDRVVRVGGSSKVPAFALMLERLFPGRVEEGEVFTSIAGGLLEAREKGLGHHAA
jgi:hypothetical chaperone protein